MRVSIKALAPVSALLLASCATVASPRHVPTDAVALSPTVEPATASVVSSPVAPLAGAPQSGNYDQVGNYDHVAPPHESGQYSPTTTGRMSILLGGRELDEAFEPADDLGVFGIEFNNVREKSTIGFEVGFLFGFDEADDRNIPGVGIGDLETAQGEVYAGLRAELSDGPVRPYVGGGGTWIRTDTTIRFNGLEASEDDSDFGWYAHGGVQLDLTETFFVGVDYRQTFDTEYTVEGVDFDGDYGQLSFVLGLSF